MNFDTEHVASIKVMVIQNKNMTEERCGSGTLVEMKRRIEEHFGARPNFDIQCVDDPEEVLHILCVSDEDGRVGPDGRTCAFARSQVGTTSGANVQNDHHVHVAGQDVDVSLCTSPACCLLPAARCSRILTEPVPLPRR